ncbi:alpha/beta hydrolase family protein [Roseateles albus]|uniref:Alpha/beta fold hydrolase n=1 Tax=Roseateles albus TaxID=2987525 RepID=A0ABT5KHX2_9BURK|nr:alpha/beta fold hydrolase [Roseateles albus]MDC8773533.1 alpha/beta fold hydrolase [Roseateles albus]
MNHKSWICALFLSLAALAPVAAREAAKDRQPSPDSIKRYVFTAESFAAVQRELEKRELVATEPFLAPTSDQSTVVTLKGHNGFPIPHLVDNVRGQFHVYGLFRRPQHPVGLAPYQVQQVVFNTKSPQVSPVGTLTIPRGKGPFAAVVLLAGSGAHTRDAGMSLHKTLWVLADHLTRMGIVVLRYDKRGVGLTGGQAHPHSTINDYADDALGAVRFLAQQRSVDPTKIGLIGHSEGGTVAALVAGTAPTEVRFVAMMAGMGLSGIHLKSLQDAVERRAEGMPDELVVANQKQEFELFEIAASPRDHGQALAAMQTATKALPDDVKKLLEIPPEGPPDEAFDGLLTPWFRHFIGIDTSAILERVRVPLLAMIGEKDMQVPAKENLTAIRQALARSGNRQATVLELPGLNHNFQTAKSGRAFEYLLIEETVAPSAMQTLTRWVLGVVR